MHQQKVQLKTRLSGLTQVPRLAAGDKPSLPAVPQPPPAPPKEELAQLRNLLAELARLAQEIQTRERQTQTEVAPVSVELGVAIAERLLAGEIAANRQRLDRIVANTLERMPAARFVVVHAHREDVALLQKLVAQHSDLERHRDLLTFRAEDNLKRGQLKLEADEWFAEWDTQRSLAELRAALLEQTFGDE
jgi:flagellar biosynthesis/type III secretory pathway protein FliH